MIEKLFGYFDDFTQKLQNIDGKLAQTRNVVNGLVHDVNAMKKPSNQTNQSINAEVEERKEENSSSSNRGKGNKTTVRNARRKGGNN